MFFTLSKIGWFFVTPSNLLAIFFLIATALLFTNFWRAGRKLGVIAVLLFLFMGLSPLGHWLLLPLENRFPQWEAGDATPAGVIVLGGASETDITVTRKQLSLNESAERMTEAVMLARRYPRAKLVFAGGDGGFLGGYGNEAEDAEKLFVQLGVPSSQLIFERKSRNTYENAQLVVKILQQNGGEWLLVTSAAHMPRAFGCFRRAGLKVRPYPVDYRTRGNTDVWRPFSSIAEGLRRVDVATREWAGLAVYYWLGYTNVLLPAAESTQ